MSTETVEPSTRSGLSQQRGRGPAAAPGDAVRGRNVLIVGINYWPEPTGIAPYTTGMAEYLAQYAESVEMLTGLPSYPSWTVPPRYRHGFRFSEERNGVTLRRLKHAVPSRQDALRRGAYEFSFFSHAASIRPVVRPHLVIGVTPALGGAAAAARLAQRCDAPLVVLVQDLLGHAALQTGIAGGDRVATAVRSMEGWALRQADAVVVVTDSFRPHLAAYGIRTDRTHTVPNWCHGHASAADREATRASLGWADGTTVALHAGNMGLKQDLGNVIEAARLTQDHPDLLWVLMGDGSQRADLANQSRGLPNVSMLPLCEPERYHDALAAADILLLNERPGLDDMCLPSKLTSYFTSGRPVASAVAPAGSAAAELRRAGAPRPAPPGDPSALARHVLALADDPVGRALFGAAGSQYAASHLTFTAAMTQLDAVLGVVLDPTPRRASANAVARKARRGF